MNQSIDYAYKARKYKLRYINLKNQIKMKGGEPDGYATYEWCAKNKRIEILTLKKDISNLEEENIKTTKTITQ